MFTCWMQREPPPQHLLGLRTQSSTVNIGRRHAASRSRWRTPRMQVEHVQICYIPLLTMASQFVSQLPQPTRYGHTSPQRIMSEMTASATNSRIAMPPPSFAGHKRTGSNCLFILQTRSRGDTDGVDSARVDSQAKDIDRARRRNQDNNCCSEIECASQHCSHIRGQLSNSILFFSIIPKQLQYLEGDLSILLLLCLFCQRR